MSNEKILMLQVVHVFSPLQQITVSFSVACKRNRIAQQSGVILSVSIVIINERSIFNARVLRLFFR